MSHIDRGTPSGQRDFALFALMFNTGARVQAILSLRVRDLHLDPSEQVRLHGKGDKIRLCPLWLRTARLLRDLIATEPTPGAGCAHRQAHRALRETLEQVPAASDRDPLWRNVLLL